MLVENTLFGVRDKVALSIARLKEFEQAAIAKHPDGYYVAFSGGKDSIVLLDLVLRAQVKHTATMNLTTVDPPELLKYVREHYIKPGLVKFSIPRISMRNLIIKKMMLPTRIVRFCCQELKERGGKGRIVATGVRWAESVKRSKRGMFETCYSDGTKQYLHPIIDWTDEDVWQYIRERKLPYCSLYDEGWKRIGCVGCPMAGAEGMKRDYERWPHFYRMYLAAAAAAAANLASLGPEFGGRGRKAKLRWTDGEAMMRWWMDEDRAVDDPRQQQLFE